MDPDLLFFNGAAWPFLLKNKLKVPFCSPFFRCHGNIENPT